jgi:hypothetical protein
MLHHWVNRRCADTHRPNGFPIHFLCNGKALCLKTLTKIMFRKFTSSFSRSSTSGYGSSGSFTWPFSRVHSGERHQRENASKVATHLAVLEGMDKKTGPRYQPRLNILGCFTLVHAFRTGKPRKLACAMTLPTHTGL